jgi:hypothetical protein
MIFTSHSLPFRCVYSSGVFEQGLHACIHVRFANPQGSQEIVAAVEAFLALGSYGALGGTGIDPVRSAIAAQRVEPPTPGQLRWSLDAPFLADDALVVLAHLLLRAHSAAAIDLVEVLGSAACSLSELATDPDESTFPGEYHLGRLARFRSVI